MAEQSASTVDPNDPLFDEFPLHLRGLLMPAEIRRLIKDGAREGYTIELVIVDAIRTYLHPPIFVEDDDPRYPTPHVSINAGHNTGTIIGTMGR